jgi:hypothetical protein
MYHYYLYTRLLFHVEIEFDAFNVSTVGIDDAANGVLATASNAGYILLHHADNDLTTLDGTLVVGFGVAWIDSALAHFSLVLEECDAILLEFGGELGLADETRIDTSLELGTNGLSLANA